MPLQNDANANSSNSEEGTLEEIQLQIIEEKLKQVANRRMEMAKQLEAAEMERKRLTAEVQKVKEELLVEQPQMGTESINMGSISQETKESKDKAQVIEIDSKAPNAIRDKRIETKQEEEAAATGTETMAPSIDQTKINDASDDSKKVQVEETKSIQDPLVEKEPTLEIQEKDQASKPKESSSETSVTSSSSSSSSAPLQEEQKKDINDPIVKNENVIKPKNGKDNEMVKKQSIMGDLSEGSEPTKNQKKTLMEYFSEQEKVQAKESNDSENEKLNKKESSETKNKNETLLEYLNQHKIDRQGEYQSNPKALNMADYLKENQWKDAETALKDFERKLQSGEIEGQVNEKLKVAQDQLKEVQKRLEEYKDSAPGAENFKSSVNGGFKVPDLKLNDYVSNDIYSKIKLPGANELITKLKSLTSDQMVSIGTPMASFVLFAALRSALEDRPVKQAEREQERRVQVSRTRSEDEQSDSQKLEESNVAKSTYSKWEEPILPRKDNDTENQDVIFYQSPSKSTLYDSEPFVSYNAPDDNDSQLLDSTEIEDDSSLPEGWYEYIDPASGNPYYWNENTGVTTWDNPLSSQ